MEPASQIEMFKPGLGDYITNGHDLFQVVGQTDTELMVDDCSWPCDQPAPLIMIAKTQPLDAWRQVGLYAGV
jgi:hypothetical protein